VRGKGERVKLEISESCDIASKANWNMKEIMTGTDCRRKNDRRNGRKMLRLRPLSTIKG
jgi:hypothetical protein